MALYGALSKHKHLSEFDDPIEDRGVVKTPEERRNEALANLTSQLSAGSGIDGVAEQYESGVEKIGGLIKTTIYVDLTGLHSTADGDIIGDEDAANCHLGQITANRSGTIVAGRVTCLEAPTGGDPDIDLWAADEATGAEDAAITGLTSDTELTDGGDHTIGDVDVLTAFPSADQYLYLVAGATTDADYTAGKLLIELFGVPA